MLSMILTIGEDTEEGVEDVRKITRLQAIDMWATFAAIIDHFDINLVAMRALMAATGAVISGSAALAILQPGRFSPKDLDIYVTAPGFAAMLVFLRSEGYEIQVPPYGSAQAKYPASMVVLTLEKRQPADSSKMINLIGTTEKHVVLAITQFHSTTVMNYISYYGMVCLYPEWTFRNIGLVLRSNASSGEREAIAKYEARGYKMVYGSADLPKYDKAHTCCIDKGCPRTPRQLLDGDSLFLPFYDTGKRYKMEEEERMAIQWSLAYGRECRK